METIVQRHALPQHRHTHNPPHSPVAATRVLTCVAATGDAGLVRPRSFGAGQGSGMVCSNYRSGIGLSNFVWCRPRFSYRLEQIKSKRWCCQVRMVAVRVSAWFAAHTAAASLWASLPVAA
jgi:hypothetical protein